jgi:hypothetical protein
MALEISGRDLKLQGVSLLLSDTLFVFDGKALTHKPNFEPIRSVSVSIALTANHNHNPITAITPL